MMLSIINVTEIQDNKLLQTLKNAMKSGAKHSIQYSDYDSNTWTVPVQLTDERIASITSDHSVTRVKLIF